MAYSTQISQNKTKQKSVNTSPKLGQDQAKNSGCFCGSAPLPQLFAPINYGSSIKSNDRSIAFKKSLLNLTFSANSLLNGEAIPENLKQLATSILHKVSAYIYSSHISQADTDVNNLFDLKKSDETQKLQDLFQLYHVIQSQQDKYTQLMQLIPQIDEIYNKVDEMATGSLNATGAYNFRSELKYNDKYLDESKNRDLSNMPLFSHDPSALDVKQGNVGDCWALSAIASIAESCPNKIKECMKDKGNGTVDIRLYNVNRLENTDLLGHSKKDKIIFQPTTPKYYNIKKVDNGGRGAVNSALWVILLEQAIAIHSPSKANFFGADYTKISGGLGEHAFSMITGEEFHAQIINHDASPADNLYKYDVSKNFCSSYFLAMTNLLPDSDRFESYERNKTALETFINRNYKSYFLDDASISKFVDAIANVDKKHVTENPSIVPAEYSIFLKKSVTIEDICEAVKSQSSAKILDPSKPTKSLPDKQAKEKRLFVLNDIINKLGKDFRLNYRLFSGNYSKHALETYNLITQQLAAGIPLCAGTVSFNGNSDGLNGEHSKGGLYGRHGYSILNVTKQIKDDKQIYYLILRNPWGRGGMIYDNQKSVTSKNPDNGIFKMELNDFMNEFSHFSIKQDYSQQQK